jgi:septal ring factor EnvC (AmiA/AmiB activator)
LFSGQGSSKWLFANRLGQVLCLSLALLVPSYAQELVEQRDRTALELRQLQEEIALSEQRKQELAAEISQLAKDRETVNRNLIETSSNARRLEKRVSKAEARLLQLRKEQDQVRGYLNNKKALLAEVLGALQRMGRKPPPALLVTPEDALSSVRSAILLGSVIPEVRAETRVLIGQLQELVRISDDIDLQKTALRNDLEGLAQDQERLNLLLAEKRKLAGKTQAELAAESARAAELAAKATSLNDLISDLETEIESAREAAEAARLAEIERKKREESRTAAVRKFEENNPFSDPGRIAPALPFSEAKGLLPLPAEGETVAQFGQDDGAGDQTSGLSLATRENARISSPADGWIVYAGPFRSYGQLLIINAGQGYHVVMAGMEKINVQPGQFVLVGEPLGVMGSQRIASAGIVDVSTTKPILYVEFRKDGKSIDPAPWWSGNKSERATNGS